MPLAAEAAFASSIERQPLPMPYAIDIDSWPPFFAAIIFAITTFSFSPIDTLIILMLFRRRAASATPGRHERAS
jgi:hypothetical protein